MICAITASTAAISRLGAHNIASSEPRSAPQADRPHDLNAAALAISSATGIFSIPTTLGWRGRLGILMPHRPTALAHRPPPAAAYSCSALAAAIIIGLIAICRLYQHPRCEGADDLTMTQWRIHPPCRDLVSPRPRQEERRRCRSSPSISAVNPGSTISTSSDQGRCMPAYRRQHPDRRCQLRHHHHGWHRPHTSRHRRAAYRLNLSPEGFRKMFNGVGTTRSSSSTHRRNRAELSGLLR